MRKMLLAAFLLGAICLQAMPGQAQERLPEYLQAEKFTGAKLKNMLFSTLVCGRPCCPQQDSAF